MFIIIMKFLLTLIYLAIPIIVSANGGEVWIPLLGFLVVSVFLLIPMLLLYLLRFKSGTVLFLIDIVFATAYAFVMNFRVPAHGITETLEFDIPALIILYVIFGIILFVEKIRGRDISSQGKVVLHGILIGIIAVLFTFSLAHGALWVLNSTNCDTNLILNSEFRESEGRLCVVTKAIEFNDPNLCNKVDNDYFQTRDFCKARIYIENIESGNLSACTHLKTLSKSVIDEAIFGWSANHQQEFLKKCGIL